MVEAKGDRRCALDVAKDIAAKKLLQAGASPRDASLSPIEHAAWTIVASVLLNLSETVTKS